MKFTNIKMLAFVLVLLLFVAGCTGFGTDNQGGTNPDQGLESYRLYFASGDTEPEDRSYLTGYTKAVLRSGSLPEDHQERIRFLMEELAKGPIESDDGLLAVMPKETEIKSLEVEDGIARMDLSSHVYQNQGALDKQGEIFMDAVILTLTQDVMVVQVEITVEGQAWTDGSYLWAKPIGTYEILPCS